MPFDARRVVAIEIIAVVKVLLVDFPERDPGTGVTTTSRMPKQNLGELDTIMEPLTFVFVGVSAMHAHRLLHIEHRAPVCLTAVRIEYRSLITVISGIVEAGIERRSR